MNIGDLVYVTDADFTKEENKMFKFLALVVDITDRGEGVIVLVDGIRMLVSRSDCAICRGDELNG